MLVFFSSSSFILIVLIYWYDDQISVTYANNYFQIFDSMKYDNDLMLFLEVEEEKRVVLGE